LGSCEEEVVLGGEKFEGGKVGVWEKVEVGLVGHFLGWLSFLLRLVISLGRRWKRSRSRRRQRKIDNNGNE